MESTVDIFVVDNDPDTLLLVQRILEMENYSVKIAQNGEEALRLIKKRGVYPRLILLDLMMPVMDGFTLLQILKSDEKYAGIPVILVTVKILKKDYDLAEKLGADGYLTKPFSSDGLVGLIREKLGE